MKIMYCIRGLFNSGGMERILIDKMNYLSRFSKYKIYVVTTDQKERAFFFQIDKKIKHIDLKINYSDDFNKNFIKRIPIYIQKQKEHKEKMESLIKELKPDILISLGDDERSFIYKFKYKKIKIIREHHFNKKYMLQEKQKNFLYFLKSYYMYLKEIFLVNKYDEFIVLTEEDKKQWKNKKVKVIPNFISSFPKEISSCENKKIISVGRLEYQKGYDILIDIWKKIEEKYPDWILEIYGNGTEKEKLQEKINNLGLEKSFLLKGVTENIKEKYLASSIYVMSSRYEGMPMVLLEAMAHGLPIVSFECPCGPKDIIKDNEDGYLVSFGNVEQMAKKIEELIINKEKRKFFGKNARKNVERFSQDKIMEKWKKLFEKMKLK